MVCCSKDTSMPSTCLLIISSKTVCAPYSTYHSIYFFLSGVYCGLHFGPNLFLTRTYGSPQLSLTSLHLFCVGPYCGLYHFLLWLSSAPDRYLLWPHFSLGCPPSFLGWQPSFLLGQHLWLPSSLTGHPSSVLTCHLTDIPATPWSALLSIPPTIHNRTIPHLTPSYVMSTMC
jgi:hypothetical protein